MVKIIATTSLQNQVSEKSIRLQTREGNDIPNNQTLELSQYEIKQAADLIKTYSELKCRLKASGVYNCHGMTFANRRTGIYDLSAIDRILKDDRYVEVDGKQILPGDVILYRASNGDIEHSGVVVEVVDRLPPMIYSKWGKAGEFIHSASRSPYDFQHVKYYRIKADEE